jgi:uncharacterized membrane protein YkvA (DUF1232 family)
MTGQASTLDRTSALRIAEQASRKAIRLRAVLEGAGDDLSAFVRLVRAWASGTYRDVPWRSMALVVGALVYFLNPLDAVPDPLPSVGLVDDISVIAFVVGVVRSDIRRFVQWEKRRRGAQRRPSRRQAS